MPLGVTQSSAIAGLLDELQALEARMAKLQLEAPASPEEERALDEAFHDWHSRARRHVAAADQKKFDEQRDGGAVMKTGISRFLADPREPSPFYKGDESGLMSPWALAFKTVRPRLQTQRNLLLDAAQEETASLSAAIELGEVFRRLPAFLRTFARVDEGAEPSVAVTNESDLQVVVEAILRMLVDDVRPEDPAPTRSGGSSRLDFVLPTLNVVVETKMTRSGLADRKVAEELMIDAARYSSHPHCEVVLAVVYDASGRIRNPRGLEADLRADTGLGVPMLCVVVS